MGERSQVGRNKWIRRIGVFAALGLAASAGYVAAIASVSAKAKANNEPAPFENSRLLVAKNLAIALANSSDGAIQSISAIMASEVPITGVLAANQNTGEPFVAWALADGDAFAVGPVYSKDGTNLTYAYESIALGENLATGGHASGAAILESHALVSRDDFTALEAAPHVVVGEGRVQLLAFYDPGCEFCQKMKSDASDMPDKVRLRLVPVAPNQNFDEVAGLMLGNAARAEEVMQNTLLMNKVVGRSLTPVIIYEDSSGRLRIRIGAPDGAEAWESLLMTAAPIRGS